MPKASSAAASRARVGAWLTPLAFAGVWLAPLPLSGEAHRLAAIVTAAVVAWITEVVPIPVTALLIAPALVVTGITDSRTAFAPYADPLLFLFYGSFFIAAAMSRHGLDRRIAGTLTALPIVAGIPTRLRAALMLAGVLLSMWISNTASSAILVPILLGTSGRDDEGQQATGGLLALAYACSVGGMGTLVGTPPNLIAVRLLQEADIQIGFLPWMFIGVPIALLLCLSIYGYFAWIDPASGESPLRPPHAASTRAWTRGERVTAWAFGLAVAGWILPGVLKAADAPYAGLVAATLPSSTVAILAASLVFLLRDDGEPVLPWREALRIDWGLIMLFGGGISLGSQMIETGLATQLGRGFLAITGVDDVWVLTALCVAFTIAFTEVCSNTATANMLIPLVLGVTAELGVSPVPPTLGVALAASCAFMMPIATGPNAVAYGTGHIPLMTMVRRGAGLNVLCGVVLFAALRILCPLYGWCD